MKKLSILVIAAIGMMAAACSSESPVAELPEQESVKMLFESARMEHDALEDETEHTQSAIALCRALLTYSCEEVRQAINGYVIKSIKFKGRSTSATFLFHNHPENLLVPLFPLRQSRAKSARSRQKSYPRLNGTLCC